MHELTAFNFDQLAAISSLIEPSGKDIQREVETNVPMYDESINHGRNYPNLDELVDAGLVEKGEQDGRTNYYTLTDDGKARLKERHESLARGL